MDNRTPISILQFLASSLLIVNINVQGSILNQGSAILKTISYCNQGDPTGPQLWNCFGSTATFDAKAHQAVSKVITQDV